MAKPCAEGGPNDALIGGQVAQKKELCRHGIAPTDCVTDIDQETKCTTKRSQMRTRLNKVLQVNARYEFEIFSDEMN